MSGAKEGFEIAVRIIPYLVAMLVAIAVFRASGALDFLVDGFAAVFGWLGIDTGFVAALPTALLKPLSGSGARAMMIETMTTYGADSFPLLFLRLSRDQRKPPFMFWRFISVPSKSPR